MNEEIEALRAAILGRWPTLYAFCKANNLPRGTVYQVMRGRYAGNAAAQLSRIRAALEVKQESGPDVRAVIKALSGAACALCGSGKRACRKKRRACRQVWQTQAAAIGVVLQEGMQT